MIGIKNWRLVVLARLIWTLKASLLNPIIEPNPSPLLSTSYFVLLCFMKAKTQSPVQDSLPVGRAIRKYGCSPYGKEGKRSLFAWDLVQEWACGSGKLYSFFMETKFCLKLAADQEFRTLWRNSPAQQIQHHPGARIPPCFTSLPMSAIACRMPVMFNIIYFALGVVVLFNHKAWALGTDTYLKQEILWTKLAAFYSCKP